MQRRLIGLLGAVPAVLPLTACGSEFGSGLITLKLVAADYGSSPEASSKKYWDEVAKDFTVKNPDSTVDVKQLGQAVRRPATGVLQKHAEEQTATVRK